jgi:hypothetical protein
MARHHKGIVISLEHGRRRRRSSARAGAEVAASAAPWLDAWPLLDDVRRNADWDRLVALVMQAWCWRDPESVDELERCLRNLRAVVYHDWS